MGDIYLYSSGGILLYTGGAHIDDTTFSGPLAFDVYYDLTFTDRAVGSSRAL